MKNTIRVCAVLLLSSSGYAADKSSTLTTTYQGFNPTSSQFDKNFNILYQLPDSSVFGPGPYPVFVWTVATYEWYADPMSTSFVAEMARRGFIGASVQYANYNAIQICTTYMQRAQGIFDATRTTSAVGVLCSMPTAGCASKGMTSAGISEGGVLAILAKNYAPNIAATYAISASDALVTGNVNLSSCVDQQYTAIPSNRLTVVDGQSDTVFAVNQANIQNVSGFACPTGTYQCWSPDGSGAGWYIVQNSQVQDGIADHCYQMYGGCTGTSFDVNWYWPATYNWSMTPNLDWLASLGTKRNFSTTGY